ncbi:MULTISPECIES: DUF6684 family protein [Halorussus]|uniref:DUF6684 family protein n=1 Tax=Halorussus TaxID=1070314 RepID=UPI00209D1454|nr:DUF6684 family protein [Halorussus vallis]USZ75618.1 cox cluster protein [Halorussus vallis]
MATPIFDRETWLDITVNLIPICIITFFLALFTVASPWPIEGLTSVVGYALLVVPFLGLAGLTYLAAQYI